MVTLSRRQHGGDISTFGNVFRQVVCILTSEQHSTGMCKLKNSFNAFPSHLRLSTLQFT